MTPTLSSHAWLWDGVRQLPGTLELWEEKVVFRFSVFRNSHMNLTILLDEIEKAEEWLVFDLARNGLRIESGSGRVDFFVLEETKPFKKALQAAMVKRRPPPGG